METIKLSFLLLAAGLGLGYLCLMCAWAWAWGRLPKLPTVKEFKPRTKVSILIAARNEELLLPATLQAILAQNYPASHFEVIVIDDHSTDNTAKVVESFSTQGVRLISLQALGGLNSYKKLAIQKGIEQATGELIVCTDADCVMGPNWLRTVVMAYETWGWTMISSPVAYFKEQSVFEKAQTLEFAMLNAMGAANFGLGKVGSCNGANLAYAKQAFLEVGGFQGIDHLASGDDELLLHKMSARFPGKQGYLKAEEAVVYTYAKPTWQEFIRQRIRWASKANFYQSHWMKYSTLWIWVFNLSLVVLGTLGLIFGEQSFLGVFGVLWLGKLGAESFFIISPLRFFKRSKLLLLNPILSFLHMFYLVYIGLAGNRSSYQWKDRTVR